ncbi:MAG: hypothetical protein RMN25_07100, partial [Anaerolineae bacterium]|nr:hypothetical protein [Thermoflexales bacterium]MDW8407537.1 hypothetical protein [Anaerolineae bacterium]
MGQEDQQVEQPTAELCVGASQPAMTDDDLSLAQQTKYNPEAFGVLYERYVGVIYRYVYYRVGNVEDAEDL